MVLRYSTKALVEIYERNERQKDRLDAIRNRMEVLRKTINDQLAFEQQHYSGMKGVFYNRIHDMIVPYVQQQRVLNQNMLDDMELLYGMEEEAIAERNSILKWTKVEEVLLPRYRAMETRRQRIQTADVRVLQYCTSLAYGDAVGNDAMTIQRALDEAGIVTGIYSRGIHPRVPHDVVFFEDELPALTERDILIYHGSIKDRFMKRLRSIPCQVLLRYHNITPPQF